MATNSNDQFAAQAQQIADVKARCNRLISVTTRGVQGGFVVTGNIQYQDKDTKSTLMAENAEGVSQTAEQASVMQLAYLKTGSFDGTAAQEVETQTNMFMNPNPSTSVQSVI